ncbi:MAG: glycosyltransferase family 4 protein [Flavobacteriales bacterium]|nr:glycosyltransferase family 4 protein [Flavobacteriales bacterium]
MRLAVNTRLLLRDKLEGIGWFAHETLSRITRAHPEHEFLFLFDRPFDPRFIYAPNVRPIVAGPPTRHPLLYRLWFEYQVPRLLRKHKADAFLSPDGFLTTRTRVPQLAVIHDLNFEHHPKDLPGAYARYYRTWFPRFARQAARIATVSEYSRQDIVRCYQVDPGRIDVVHNGVGEVFSPLSEQQQRAVRTRLTGGAPYFICVGSLHPRKNIARLITAFDRFAEQVPDVRLVVVGEAFWWDARMKAAHRTMRHADRLNFTGRLGQEALRDALASALALAYVSYFEGFGIPVVEAMRCGTPVLAANATSLPEVAGDAALYCDPFNVDRITEALLALHGDVALRERLHHAGIQRAAQFSWDHTAAGLWASVERMMARQS